MISLIISSREHQLTNTFVVNIAKTIGVVYELITIDNSGGKVGIAEAYNQGIAKSKYPYLCFVHDDVIFHTKEWGKKVIAHLDDESTGLIGVAGSKLVTRIPASWSAQGKHLQLIQGGKRDTGIQRIPEDFHEIRKEVVLLDGVLLCMRRDRSDELRFEDQVGGFHGYDLAISFRSVHLGYKNYVVYDIQLEHFSSGRKDARYYANLLKIFEREEQNLPMSTEDLPDEATLRRLEEKNLRELLFRMVRRGFTMKEIKSRYKHYTQLTGIKWNDQTYFMLMLQLHLLRSIYIFNDFPRNHKN